MIVRELFTRWGFKVDTAPVTRFQTAISVAKHVVGGVTKAVGIFAAGTVAAGAALIKLTQHMAEGMDKTLKVSQRISVGTELLQQLGHAADLGDVSIETLQGGLRKLGDVSVKASKGGKEAVAAFNELGISVKDQSGKLKDNDTLIQEVLGGLADYPAGSKKTALAMDLLGRAGTELLPMLDGGRFALAETMAEAKKLGVVMGGDALRGAADFNDSMTRLKASARGVLQQFASGMMPMMTGWMVKLRDWFVANRAIISQNMQKVAAGIAGALKGMVEAAGKYRVMELLGGALKLLINSVSWLLSHQTAVKWFFITLMGLGVASKLTGIAGAAMGLAGVVGKLAQALPGAATGMSALSANTALWGAGIAGAAAAGYAFGTWLDKTFGLSEKLSDSLMKIRRLVSKDVVARRGAAIGREEVIRQAQSFGEMARRGVQSFGVAGGGRMALTQENMMATLQASAKKLGVNDDNFRFIKPQLIKAISQTANPTLNVNVTVPPGTPGTMAQRVADAAGTASKNQLRRALADVAAR